MKNLFGLGWRMLRPSQPSKSLVQYYSKLIHNKKAAATATTNPTGKANWKSHENQPESYSKYKLNIDINLKEDPEDLFPTFTKLNVLTSNRTHRFEAKCDTVIRFIKLGAINKNIATQYCHYLAHLSRTCGEDDHAYYWKRALDLLLYLLKNGDDLTFALRVKLLCDVASTSESNCTKICEELIDQYEMKDKFFSRDWATLMAACYKFKLWKTADKITGLYEKSGTMDHRIFDPLVLSLVKSETDGENKTPVEAVQIDDIMNHMFNLMDIGYRDRVQFITRYPDQFIKGLEDLGVKIVKNPVVKLSGRCTHCDTILPLYNNREASELNQIIRGILEKRTEENLILNTSTSDLNSFKTFLDDLYGVDKKPIDCVIDGPNICYRNSVGYFFYQKEVNDNFTMSVKRHNPGHQVQVLVNTILRNDMLNKFKKILVIGKHHMSKWPGLIEFFERHNIRYYFTNNETKDDLMQLYAATLNPKTILITNDFLRDHISQLHGQDRTLLERWIDTHQCWVVNKNLKAIWPTPYQKIPSVDRKTGYFHVPMIDYNKFDTFGFHEPPPHLNNKMLSWLCCRRVNQVDKIESH